MNEDQIKEIVYKNYSNGFHCAESIVNTIQEIFPGKTDGAHCNQASGFCGGIGKCKQDICGALSGGIIALGSIYGREKGGDDISRLIFLSVELRNKFINEFQSTVCKNVIENMEKREEYKTCRNVTAKTTFFLYDLIKDDFQEK